MATLLIVDDDTSIRETLQELFSEAHECHTADRAEQALAYLDLETYDVVITDISMPGLGGEEILKRIQEKTPATPVIVVSGMPDKETRKKLLKMGAFAYFTKPYDLEEVEKAVVRAIAHRQELLRTTQSQPGSAEDSSKPNYDGD